MKTWKEFEIFIKFPDNEILGKEGEQRKVKSNVDLSKVVFFYESSHTPSGESGTSLNFIGGEDLFIVCEYESFKAIMFNLFL